jgi:hypothetical protein
MTTQEAIDTLAGFRKAFRALDPTKAMQAINALLNSGPVATAAGSMHARDFASVLSTLKAAFDAMDNKGI